MQILRKSVVITLATILLISTTLGTYQTSDGINGQTQSLFQYQLRDMSTTIELPDVGNLKDAPNSRTNMEKSVQKPIKIITNSLLVKIKTNVGDARSLNGENLAALDKTFKDLSSDISSKGGKAIGAYRQLGILHVRIGDPKAPLQVFEPTQNIITAFKSNTTNPMLDNFRFADNFRKSIESNPLVESVNFDSIIPLTAQVIPTGINRVDADRSPAISGDGMGTTKADIAILDTGVQFNHPDLNVVGCISFVNNNTPGIIGSTPLYNCTDNLGHGTHVAGIAAAEDDGIGVVGVAPGANIHAINVCGPSGCLSSDIIEGLNYVAAHYREIDVVNLSLGGYVGGWSWLGNFFGTLTEILEDSVTDLVNKYGVVVVVSAMNEHADAKDYSPARVKSAITVSSITDYNGRCGGDPNKPGDDSFSSFSNYGSVIDLAAPGKDIFSTVPQSKYGIKSGTSMAAPHVTGAVALYLSIHPTATPAEVEQHLKSSATKAPKQFQETTVFSCDKQGKGYFSTYFDTDGIREPLLYLGWDIPGCPPDCPAAEDVDKLPNNDFDNDGLVDSQDNCRYVHNSDQIDTDLDNRGNSCDSDDDNDGVDDSQDNCKTISNHNQNDTDEDGIGDVCDPDDDNDNKPDVIDNCDYEYNPDQRDSDHDRIGDACDIDDVDTIPEDLN